MAAYERSRGKTLFEKLLELYVQHGYYLEHLISITKKGRDGQQQIAEMMDASGQQPPLL
jgi:phosphoglucomutase